MTLISAIARLVNARWRRPVTRCAEVITVFALMIDALLPIVHLGLTMAVLLGGAVPEFARDLAELPTCRWYGTSSPSNTYLTSSVLFLILPMIPDLALVRDRSTGYAAASTAHWRSAGRARPSSGTGSSRQRFP